MTKETDIGAGWWAELLSDLPSEKVQIFKKTLQQSFIDHFQGHWDPQHTMKGSGYRSITADSHRIDPLLVNACSEANIPLEDFCRLVFRRGNDHIMFINPGEVRIRNGALLTTSSSLLWSANPQPVVPSNVSTPGSLMTPGGSTIHGGNINNSNVNGSMAPPYTSTSGTLSRNGMHFTPSIQQVPSSAYLQNSGQLGSTHGSISHSNYGNSVHGSSSTGPTQGGHLHRNAINAPAWAPDSSIHDYEGRHMSKGRR
jgi:hypothetical protein